MKPAPEIVTHDGMTLRLSMRKGDICLFQDLHDKRHFEIMRVRRHKRDREMRGVIIAHAGDEYLPSTEKWGVDGFTAIGIAHATEIFNREFSKQEASNGTIKEQE